MSVYFMSALHTKPRHKQSGVALITILLIVALLTAIVSRIGLSGQLWVRQVENGNALARARQATVAAQLWVADILEQDTNAYDGADDIWAQILPPIPAGWGILSGRIEDMQSRFNLNNLIDAEGKVNGQALQQFERLLQILKLDTGIAQSVTDWIDIDGSPSGPWGAEDVFYIGLATPYFAANRPFEDVAELRLVRGVDSEVWQKLAPFVCALPELTMLNINTASTEVLAATVIEWDLSGQAMTMAKQWTDVISKQPVADQAALAERLLGDREKPVPPGLQTVTRYFLAHTQLNFDNVEYRVSSLYRRNEGKAELLRQNRELL